MKYLKNIAVIILAVMILLLSGCRGKVQKPSPEKVSSGQAVTQRNYLTLLYSSSDTFNPYNAKTDINRQLCKLLYEPLIKLDNDFKINYCVASSIEVRGKTCKAVLNDVTFSDGSRLTADDVVYSFKLAKASSTEYAFKLYEAQSASAEDSKTVVFKLTKADPFFANLLDFPILKAGSENKKDTDSVLLPPVGSGRYKVKNDRNGLVVNDKFGKLPFVKEIRLINAPDKESLTHYVEIGAADMYYSDISDGNIIRMSGEKLNININHLVYIGVNKNISVLEENSLRQAISTGIDRKAICRDCFYNNAIAATGFFNPSWDMVKSVQNIQTEPDKEITVENLEKIGYNKLDGKGSRKNAAGAYLDFSMLVNSENRLRASAARLISSQLAQYGIRITVIEKPYAEYMAALTAGNFDLYLGEVEITPNMDVSSLVVDGGSAAFGNKKKDAALTDKATDNPEDKKTSESAPETAMTLTQIIEGFYNGINTISDIASVLQTEMPLIPVCYRTGVLFYNDNIENINISSSSDIYFSIESYTINN